jgi:hypothetical protein
LFSCSRKVNNKGICLSFRLQRESLDSEGVKLIEKERQYLLPLQAVQREIAIDTVDPVVLVDIPRDFAVGHKRPVWA